MSSNSNNSNNENSDNNNVQSNGLEGHDDEVEQKPAKKAAKHDSGAADLERVTDHVEERELSQQDIAGALTLINDRRSQENEKKAARQLELSKITVKKEDVDLIAKEMEISRTQAELRLREHAGSIVDALISLTD